MNVEQAERADEQAEPVEPGRLSARDDALIAPDGEDRQRGHEGIHAQFVQEVDEKGRRPQHRRCVQADTRRQEIPRGAVRPGDGQQPDQQRERAQAGRRPAGQPAPAVEQDEVTGRVPGVLGCDFGPDLRRVERAGHGAAAVLNRMVLVAPERVGIESARAEPEGQQQQRNHSQPDQTIQQNPLHEMKASRIILAQAFG